MRHDLRFALRHLLKNPGFAAVVVLMFALGIGSNTVVFSVAKAVLFRSLGVKAEEQVVWLRWVESSTTHTREDFSWTDFADLRASAKSFQQLALIAWPGITWEHDNQAEELTSLVVSPTLADLLSVRPVQGRSLVRVDPMVALRAE